ncbi:hypothetical protein [Arcobacter vandammei]|uniref:hypothetical protein n=1 Tax=Arcobacter vandammei TaxID=2782243 RepID=UPI0018DF2415|nr:hypothetical protein [Arcobacter vandammei]
MDKQKVLSDECKKDKELFNSNIKVLVIFVIFCLFIVAVLYYDKKNKKELYSAFEKGDELICNNFIVSKNLGFKLDKKGKDRVSDGKNTFIIYNCMVK